MKQPKPEQPWLGHAKLEWQIRIQNMMAHKVSILNGHDAIQMMKRIEAVLKSAT